MTEQPAPAPKPTSRILMLGVGAIGVLLGLAISQVAFDRERGSGPGGPALYDEKMVTAVVRKVSPAVAEIQVTSNVQARVFGGVAPDIDGSGFLVDDKGHFVTNYHVVRNVDKLEVRLSDGRVIPGRLLGYSAADDLALVQVEPAEVAGIKPLVLGDSGKVQPGQLAIAVGSPFQLNNSVTLGIISGTGRSPNSVLERPIPNMIQTDAPLNPGNSGGPLLNSRGEVVGVTSAADIGSPLETRIGFAVPSSIVASLLPDLISGEHVRRPWLGISGGALTRGLAEARELGVDKGIYVTRVFPNSPAEAAGLVPDSSGIPSGKGDIITRVDGRRLNSVTDMVDYLNGLRPGHAVTLTVVRDKLTLEVQVALGEFPDT